MLCVVCGVLSVVCCVLVIVGRKLRAMCRLLFVGRGVCSVCCLTVAACCMLFVG